MDKNTFASYGWIVCVVIVIAIMIGLATPFGDFITAGVNSSLTSFKGISDSAMNGGSGGSSNLGDQGGSGGESGGPNEQNQSYTVQISVNDPSYGTAEFIGEHSGMSVTLSGEETLTLKATANSGYEFLGWYDEDALLSANAEYSLQVNRSLSIEARFNVICLPFVVESYNRGKIGYTGAADENLIIPEKFQDTDGTWYKVTSIGKGAFESCTNLKSVEIPASVKTIKSEAFFYCLSLTSVKIPEGVTSIETMAFQNCSSLTSIDIPASVTSLSGAFYGCSNLKTVYYGGDLEQWCGTDFVSEYANPCNSGAILYIQGDLVDDIVIPNTIATINNWAFYGCTSLTSVTIPEGVTSIGDRAFYACTSLASIEIPDSVASIGESAFARTALTSVTIPDNITTINKYTFTGCQSLMNVEFSANVTFIGYGSFGGCAALTNIHYGGTTTQWTNGSIEFGGENWSAWNNNTGNYTVYCTDGTVAKDGTITLY